jgi:hypothetical protein
MCNCPGYGYGNGKTPGGAHFFCFSRREPVRFGWGMPPPTASFDVLRAELEAEVATLRGEVAELKRLVAALRDENARLKGLKGRPVIKPSGMENVTEPKRHGKRRKRPGRGKVTPRVAVETKVICQRR